MNIQHNNFTIATVMNSQHKDTQHNDIMRFSMMKLNITTLGIKIENTALSKT